MRGTGNITGLALIENQSSELAALISRIATAGPSELAALQSEVIAAAAAVAECVQQAGDAGASTDAAASLANACADSRAEVASVMAGMGDFRIAFASPDDEQGYREREAQRRADLAAQQAKNTPEGDLNAAGEAVGQMVDARAHGAAGPEFDRRWNALVETTERLRAAAKANGVSTEEFDRRLSDDLRRIMKAKGFSSAEIDARFAANPDPLETARELVHDGVDLAAVRRSAERAGMVEEPTAAAPLDQVQQAIALMKTSGISAPPDNAGAAPAHGLSARTPPPAPVRTV